MKPIDYRDDTWEHLQDRISGLRLVALLIWRKHGPGTTREVAARGGLDLLSFRPRTTELHQLGLVVVDDDPAHADERGACEGRYRALSDTEARAIFEQRAAAARGNYIQPELKLPTAT